MTRRRSTPAARWAGGHPIVQQIVAHCTDCHRTIPALDPDDGEHWLHTHPCTGRARPRSTCPPHCYRNPA